MMALPVLPVAPRRAYVGMLLVQLSLEIGRLRVILLSGKVPGIDDISQTVVGPILNLCPHYVSDAIEPVCEI